MNKQTAHMLNTLTCDFYRTQAQSFSQTRHNAWKGWTRALDEVHAALRKQDAACVLDLGCGNMRFERFLADYLTEHGTNETAPTGSPAQHPVHVYAIDNCTPLAEEGLTDDTALIYEADGEALPVCFQAIDIVSTLLEGDDLARAIEAPPCALSVAFGLFHHIPTGDMREHALQALIDKTRPGGFVIVSFWQFLRDERIAAKAQETTRLGCTQLGIDEGDLDEGDFLLGWQDEPDVFRYCHSFTEEEIDALSASAATRAREVARFSADGKNDNLNRYLVMRVL